MASGKFCIMQSCRSQLQCVYVCVKLHTQKGQKRVGSKGVERIRWTSFQLCDGTSLSCLLTNQKQMEGKKASKEESTTSPGKLHMRYEDRWLTLRDLPQTNTTRTGCHMWLTRTLSTPMDLLAAPVENGLLGNKHTHALRRGPEPCRLPEREEGPAALLWHSDHLLSPANTPARQGDPEPGSSLSLARAHTHACTTSKHASFPAYSSSALILITLFASLYPTSLSVSLLIPPLLSLPSIHLAHTPTGQKKHRPPVTHTHHYPPPSPGDDFSTASALLIQPRRVPIYS